MNSKKPILSISLLSCGREKTIQKCLDSLKTLMERVPSELIIVDTGCNDEVKEMMSHYTDKIVPFTWCDDFSKARNVGLEAAAGEWFLYLDDDEWFIDTKEIEDFFLSGEYKKYMYACYVQRNYTKKNKELYTDAWVSRMVRRDPNVRFVSCIHEFFHPLVNPYKLINSYVEHFGYCYDSKEEEQRHSMRNITLLEKQLQKEKSVIRWWTHLMNEYRALEEYNKVKELAHEGLKYFKKYNEYDINRERGSFYCAIVESEILQTLYDDAITDAKKALEDKRNNLMCRTRLHNLLADAYYRTENYAEAKKHCEEYIKGYERFKDDPQEKQNQTAFFVMNAMEPSGIYSSFCFYIVSCLKEGDSSVLKKYFWTFGWNDILILHKTFVADLVEAMSEVPYEELFVQAADTMAKRSGLVALWEKLLEIEKKYRKATGEEQERFYRIAHIFSQVNVRNYYIWYLKVLYADHIGDGQNMDHYFSRLFHYLADFLCLDKDIFDIAEKYHVNISKIFEEIPFDKWKLGVDSFFAKSAYSVIQARKEFLLATMPKTENGEMAEISDGLKLRYDYFFMKIAGMELILEKNSIDFNQLQETFRDFSNRTLSFYSKFFKDIAFEGEMPLLPAECRAAVRFHDLLDAQLADDRQKIAECLKKAVGVFMEFDETIKTYTKLYAEWEKARLEDEHITPEMRALAGQIKSKILELLEQNLVVEALQAVQQLKTFIPNDSEIAALEKQILLRMS